MLKSLRSRFILSHTLPLFIIVPLMGIVLIYVLETQVVLASLASELQEQAILVAESAAGHPEIWSDPAQAHAFVARLSPHLTAQVRLVSPAGDLLASSDPADIGQLGQRLSLPGLAQALTGNDSVHTRYSRDLRAEVADVIVPVVGSNHQIVGAVRLTQQLAGVAARFLRLRAQIAAVLVVGLVLGASVGLVLALQLERPLRQITRTIAVLADGQQPASLPEQGPAELHTLAQACNTLAERLWRLEETRRQLLANLVHELRRPLGAMHSAIEALQRGATAEQALREELLAGMDDEVDRLQRVVNDLTRLHEQIIGTLELKVRPVALHEWLIHVLTLRRAAAESKGINWEVTIPADLPSLELDPDRLAEAVGNLVNNAIKYTPPGGAVAVRAGVADDDVWVCVSDTGPGIASDEQTRIFAPFYRARTTHRFPQGMGLGLTIAHDVVAAHGGRLDVQSSPGQGSQFTLWLPCNSHRR